MFTTTKKVSLVAAAVVLSLGVLAFGTGCGAKEKAVNADIKFDSGVAVVQSGEKAIAPADGKITLSLTAKYEYECTEADAKQLNEGDFVAELYKSKDKASFWIEEDVKGGEKHPIEVTNWLLNEEVTVSAVEKTAEPEGKDKIEKKPAKKTYDVTIVATVDITYDDLQFAKTYKLKWTNLKFNIKAAEEAQFSEAQLEALPEYFTVNEFGGSNPFAKALTMTVWPTITYDFGEYGENIQQVLPEGQVVEVPEAYVVMGAEFQGYFMDEEFTTPFDPEETINLDTTVYAKYGMLVGPEVPETGDATPFAMAFAGLFAAAAIALFATRSLKKD